MKRNRRSSMQTLSIFEVLMDRPRSWHYGYELAREAELSSGTLYPTLMRLADRGLLESKWEPSPERGRPPRHMYRLTVEGAAHAKDELMAAAGRDRRLTLRGKPA